MTESRMLEYMEMETMEEKEVQEEMADMVHHPPHYEQYKPQPLQVIEAWRLPFHEAQVIKYVPRWKDKGGIEDLKKARFYLNRLILKHEPDDEEAQYAAIDGDDELFKDE